jgi:hypothetical protein
LAAGKLIEKTYQVSEGMVFNLFQNNDLLSLQLKDIFGNTILESYQREIRIKYFILILGLAGVCLARQGGGAVYFFCYVMRQIVLLSGGYLAVTGIYFKLTRINAFLS